tara:strand:+ start:33703 stop:34974 length:1272 start_codon:yes stop_codon:yes gene_type:complete
MALKQLSPKLLPIWIAIGAILISAWMFFTAPSTNPLPPEEVAWPVNVLEIEKKNYSPNMLIFGTVESLYNTTLRAGITGYVESLVAQEGLNFKKGDKLAQINPIDAKLNVTEQATNVSRLEALIEEIKNKNIFDKIIYEQQNKLINLSKSAVERQQKLAKKSVASQANIEETQIKLFREIISLNERKRTIDNFEQELKQLEADKAREVAKLDIAKLNLSRTRIIAPFNGRINNRAISIGDRVQNNQELISLYDTEHLEIRAQFPTDQINILQNALEKKEVISATISNLESNLNITLSRLAGEINRDQAGIEALFRIQEPNPPLRIGQTVKLKVRLPPKDNLISIPFTALYDISDGYIVYKVTEKDNDLRLQAVPVNLVGEYFNNNNQKFMLIQGETLKNQDRVLITRLPYARDALKVVIREKK